MVKHYLVLLGFILIILTSMQVAKSETIPKAEEMYVTTEDIISDIIFPTIDKRVIKEYGGDNRLIWCVLQQKSAENCNEKYRVLPPNIFPIFSTMHWLNESSGPYMK